MKISDEDRALLRSCGYGRLADADEETIRAYFAQPLFSIGEPNVTSDDEGHVVGYSIPITLRGKMASDYAAWRKENGYDDEAKTL